MKKKLLFFILYQLFLTQKIVTHELEIKESSEIKIVKKYFHPLLINLNKDELKSWLLLAAIPGMAEKLICERPSNKEDLDKELKQAITENNYEQVVALLKQGRNPMKGSPHSPFTLVTFNKQLNIKKLFVWHNDIPRCYIMLDDAAIFIKDDNFQEIAKFMISYAPKISRIKNENIIKKLNEFLSTSIKATNLIPELNKLIEKYCLYPENPFEQINLTYQDIDEIIALYDNEFNKNNEQYKRLLAEAEGGLQKIEIFEIEENVENTKKLYKKKSLTKKQKSRNSCYCILYK